MNINIISTFKFSSDLIFDESKNETTHLIADSKTIFFPFILALLSSGPFSVFLIETIIKKVLFEALKQQSEVNCWSKIATDWKNLISSTVRVYQSAVSLENASILQTPVMPYTIMRFRNQPKRASPEMSFDINAYTYRPQIQSSSPISNREASCIVTTINEVLRPSIASVSTSNAMIPNYQQTPTSYPSNINSNPYILTFGMEAFTPLNVSTKKDRRTRDNGRLRNHNLLKKLNN